MPAYNAEKTLEKTLNDIPFTYVDEIILVDDNSNDNTIEKAKSITQNHPEITGNANDKDKVLMTIFKKESNGGYGSNQKQCYKMAIAHGADIIVMLHPDYQYDPRIIKYFVEFMSEGYFDVMLGSRIRSRKEALSSGMPRYKYFANRFLSLVENLATSRVISDWHTGMRAYKKEVLESIDYNQFSDDFIFDTQMMFAIISRGYSIGDIPVPVRYFKDSSSINFKRSLRYGILTVLEIFKYLFRKRN